MKTLLLWTAILVCIAALPGCSAFESVSVSATASDGKSSVGMTWTGVLRDPKVIKRPKVVRYQARKDSRGIWHERLWDTDNREIKPLAEAR